LIAVERNQFHLQVGLRQQRIEFVAAMQHVGEMRRRNGAFFWDLFRDSADPDFVPYFPFYSMDHCIGYLSWRFTIWPGIIYFGKSKSAA